MARHPARGILLLMWVLCVSVRCQATQTEETPTPPMGVEPGKGDDALERLTVLVSSALKNALDPITSELNGQRTTRTISWTSSTIKTHASNFLNTRLDSINARLDSTGLQTTLQAALSAASICSNAAAAESATRQHCSALRDCSDLPTGACSGVYTLHLGRDRAAPAQVFCDLDTGGGDWTVFQRRADIVPRENFYRNWTEYKTGFGELTGEFWWGLEKLWLMTEPIGRRYELRVDLEDFNGQRKHAVYQDFRVSSERDGYRLTARTYSGDAGDSLSYHFGQPFSTKDRDNDSAAGECAVTCESGWWFKECFRADLNGVYLSGETSTDEWRSISWNTFHGFHYSLKSVEMKIRPMKFE
ncbi:microfibril-associated glycoprotein 4-like [Amphibalanus amphitrite]|uniref:microfibril-associated glycoprotein 4-like n=1 Tax=Amphibalanus amphitrite TaxID=1232801 RepID=UPI001C9010B6|nr:microfibril-associated glycoprotein 4-like [Amphibalanus amphitrite]